MRMITFFFFLSNQKYNSLHDFQDTAKIDKYETLGIRKYISIITILNLLSINLFYLRAWQDVS